MNLTFEYCGTIKFALLFGLKNVLKETVRLILRQFLNMKLNKILICKVNDEIVGYGAVIKASEKFSFAENSDFILGPYWVNPNFRNQGIGAKIVEKLTHDSKSNVFAYICKTNKPSIIAMQNAGYTVIGYMEKVDGKYILTQDSDKENALVVVKYKKVE